MRESGNARSDGTKGIVRVLFACAAGFLLLTKIGLARAAATDGNMAQRLGAATAYLLLLLIGYRLAMGTPPHARVRVALVGVAAVVAGALAVPPVGFALLVVAYFLRRSALASEPEQGTRPAAKKPPKRSAELRKPSAGVKKPPLGEAPLPPLAEPSAWFEVRVDAPELAIDTADGGRLEIEPGELCVRLRTKQLDDGEIAFLVVSLELADQRGTVWTSTTVLRADAIIDALDADDPADGDAPIDEELGPSQPRPPLVPFGAAPAAWRTALRAAPLGRSLVGLLDSRFYRNLEIGGRTRVVQMKYQGPRFDVGWLDARTLVASVRELTETLNPQSPNWDVAPIPPFAFMCPSSVLVWFIAQEQHARDLESVYDEPVSAEPPVVSSVPGRHLAPQPRVVFREAREEG